MFYDGRYARRRFKNNRTRIYPNLGGNANAESVGTHRRLKGWHFSVLILLLYIASAWLFDWIPWRW